MIKLLVSWSSHPAQTARFAHCISSLFTKEKTLRSVPATVRHLRDPLPPGSPGRPTKASLSGVMNPGKGTLAVRGEGERPGAPASRRRRRPTHHLLHLSASPGGETRPWATWAAYGRPRSRAGAARGRAAAPQPRPRDTHLCGHEGRCAPAGLPVAAEAGGRAARCGGQRRGR